MRSLNIVRKLKTALVNLQINLQEACDYAARYGKLLREGLLRSCPKLIDEVVSRRVGVNKGARLLPSGEIKQQPTLYPGGVTIEKG